ncbi:hypothetical protein FNH22_12250 [Fulvivirga sp. M361]|uniref:hypothetical protein n=1 Tax=Fulvivirga sp. M361 TaxID=2594266 RepID=UPI00117B9B6F|nr:hypothetical protein [Fulvivirga sp. M361]TRX58645.1 hypothetical protein FNH22_12250 [Fulvivirga sp. M361]
MKNIALIIFVFTCFVQISYAGGGWPQPAKKGYFKLGQSFIISDSFYDLNGDIIDITTISLYTTSLYGEYGITDRLTGIIYMPFFVRSTLNDVERRQSQIVEPGDAVNSFGDTDISLKYALSPGKKIVVSASLLFGLPFGKIAEGTTDSGDPRILQTGDGEFNQMIYLDASRSFYPAPFYASIGAGFNNRTENFSDEVRYSAELGYTGIKDVTLSLKISGVQSLQNGDSGGGAGNGLFGNNVEFFSFGPEVSYGFTDQLGITAAAAFAASGTNILASPNFSAGVFFKL